jgi:hypothetical protein
VLVCGGVLLLPKPEGHRRGRFQLPYINAKWITPVLFIVGVYFFRDYITSMFSGENVHENFPFFIFLFLSAVLTVTAFVKNLSLIPVLGLLSCLYLMTEMGYTNWLRFLVWLVVGLDVYICYSYENSSLGGKVVAYHKTCKIIGLFGAILAALALFLFDGKDNFGTALLYSLLAAATGFLVTYTIANLIFKLTSRREIEVTTEQNI